MQGRRRRHGPRKLECAETIFRYLENRYKAGFKTTDVELERAKMARDLAAAELYKDPLEAARSKVAHTERILKFVEMQHKVGAATVEDLAKAKLDYQEAEAGLRALTKDPKGQPPSKAPPGKAN